MATLPTWASSLSHQLVMPNSPVRTRSGPVPPLVVKACSKEAVTFENDLIKRRAALVGIGTLATGLSFSRCASADARIARIARTARIALFRSIQTYSGTARIALFSLFLQKHGIANELFQSLNPNKVPKNYKAFVDKIDGYSYYYPSDWRDFDFLGHDSAFKDKFAALQHVRVGFIPTSKTDVHDLGPMDEAIFNLVKNIYAAPTQVPTIYEMTERTVDGKNYWTFEYELESPNFARSAFATIAIGNGRYYTLIVGANQRRWSRVRNQLKVVADSFKMLDI